MSGEKLTTKFDEEPYVAIQFKSCIGMNKSIVWYIGVWFLCTRIICEYELSIDVFCFINKNFKMKSLMKTRKQKETGEKEVHLLEQKGYEKMVNEIVPVQQAEVYRKPTHKAVKEAVKELNPDTNSLGSRG